MAGDLLTLGLLVLLQIVLGFDNLLYISLESKRVQPEKQQMVRRWGIGLAILLRIGLLLLLWTLLPYFEGAFAHVELGNAFTAAISGHALIVLFGGGFIIYTATKEIWHMISLGHDQHAAKDDRKSHRSPGLAIFWIVVMNLVFSFDSILSALALTKVFWVMAAAIVISGILMIVVADKVSAFLQRNRMYEVLGLFVLLLVGVMLVTEGGHLAHIKLWSHPVEAMSKSTFYFVITVLVVIDVVQGRYQKKLMAEKEAGESAAE